MANFVEDFIADNKLTFWGCHGFAKMAQEHYMKRLILRGWEAVALKYPIQGYLHFKEKKVGRGSLKKVVSQISIHPTPVKRFDRGTEPIYIYSIKPSEEWGPEYRVYNVILRSGNCSSKGWWQSDQIPASMFDPWITHWLDNTNDDPELYI